MDPPIRACMSLQHRKQGGLGLPLGTLWQALEQDVATCYDKSLSGWGSALVQSPTRRLSPSHSIWLKYGRQGSPRRAQCPGERRGEEGTPVTLENVYCMQRRQWPGPCPWTARFWPGRVDIIITLTKSLTGGNLQKTALFCLPETRSFIVQSVRSENR